MLTELKDRLNAMRKQEVHYRCCDYTRPPLSVTGSNAAGEPAVPSAMAESSSQCSTDSDLVHLWLEECAALVTDPLTRLETSNDNGCSSNQSNSSTPRRQAASPIEDKSSAKNATIPNSPSGVEQFPANDATQQEEAVNTASSSTLGNSCSSGNWLDDEEEDTSNSASNSSDDAEMDATFLKQVHPDLGLWRLQMFDWACMVVDGFQMDRCEVLATAFNLLDRYTSSELQRPDSPPITRDDYQLFAMTALYMAVKILEPFPRKIGLDALTVMSRDFYKPHDIIMTEMDMLAVLQWRTTPPSSIAFCRELVRFLFPFEAVMTLSHAEMEQKYSTLCDVTVSDPSFLNYAPSIIAVAVVLHMARLNGSPQRERFLLQKQALGVLGFADDEEQLANLEEVYAKMELFYC